MKHWPPEELGRKTQGWVREKRSVRNQIDGRKGRFEKMNWRGGKGIKNGKAKEKIFEPSGRGKVSKMPVSLSWVERGGDTLERKDYQKVVVLRKLVRIRRKGINHPIGENR